MMSFACSLGPCLLTLLLVFGSCDPVFSDDGCGNTAIIREPGRCMWFGTCLNDSDYIQGGQLNCLDNNHARNISTLGKDFEDLLRANCPQYLNGPVCCDYSMLNTLVSQLTYPKQLFGRCPACIRNFIDHFCATTCDPNQSLFMDPSTCKNGTTNAGVKNPAIVDIHIYLTSKYADDMYDSCSKVQYPQASNRVVDIMCGGTDNCDPSLWLGYLGSPTENNNSPFPMEYFIGSKKVPTGVKPREYNFLPCNTTSAKYQCSCADCGTHDLCPDPPKPPAHQFPQTTVFYSVLGVGLFLSVLLFCVAMAAGLYMCVRDTTSTEGYAQIKDDSPTSSVGSINAEDPTNVRNVNMAAPPSPPSSVFCCVFEVVGNFENYIKTVFYYWGCFVTTYWYLVIGIGVGVVFLLMGLTVVLDMTRALPFDITTDPVKLWSAPDSRARQEKNYFDANFNPFYRTEMMIFTAKEQIYSTFQPAGTLDTGTWTVGPVLTDDVLLEVLDIQNYLSNMVVEGTLDNGTEVNVTLNDICYQPLAPDNTNCTIMSVLNYFQNDKDRLLYTSDFDLVNNSYHIHYCTRDPTSPKGSSYTEGVQFPCLGAFGGPVDPNVALGGFNTLPNGSPNYQNATALIVVFTVNNHLNESENQYAKIWEKAFLDYLVDLPTNHTNFTYMAERSIEDELTRESKTDVYTVLLSYVLMFVYITLFLGHIRKPVTLFIDMKISVGFLGVLLVLFAVVASICLLNLARVTVTLIIIEVVPFLVLAVGVDNLFIIVHSYERQVRKFSEARNGDIRGVPVKELIGRAIAEVAPSLLLTSLSETTAFLLGAISSMPAVRTFSLYAGVAVFFNFVLQISVFVAALSLDARRQLGNRYDLFCCCSSKGYFDPRKGLDIMHSIMGAFAKFILSPIVRPFVLLLFGVTTTVSLAMTFRLDVGLDQTSALPKDSYVNSYFTDLYEYLHTGSPVYFVIKEGFNYSDPEYQAMFCTAAGCDKQSIGTEVFAYSRNKEMTGIAEPAMLWLDTYFEWIGPDSKCCGISNKGEFCLHPVNTTNSTCMPCVTASSLNQYGWPNADDFGKYLKWFLMDNPGTRCPSGGHAAFAGGVKLNHDNKTVNTSYVMTLHTIMSNSSSFINGLKWARKLGDQLTNYTGVQIFPYSVFYVYYEQYLTTFHDMALNIGVSIGAVFIVTFLMMGMNLWAALIVMLIVCMIIIHMLGCMALTHINANAVSLVNLVMTVGISVEFCSHIVRWFCSCNMRTRTTRAHDSLANMGASVVSGITLTKLIGVFVLFFAKSQIFEVYYFRMYMFMLLWGALHGLVFLPVLLSYIGPSYSPMKANLPYSDLDLRAPHVRDSGTSPKAGGHGGSNGSSTIPTPSSTTTTMPAGSGHYPSLPNVGNYQAPSTGNQQYAPPTFPGQRQDQEKGEVYPQPNERSKLLNP